MFGSSWFCLQMADISRYQYSIAVHVIIPALFIYSYRFICLFIYLYIISLIVNMLGENILFMYHNAITGEKQQKYV